MKRNVSKRQLQSTNTCNNILGKGFVLISSQLTNVKFVIVCFCRKICNHCRCLAEDHDLPSCQQRDCRPMSMLFQSSPSPRDPASSSPSPSPYSPPSPPCPAQRPSDWSTQFEKLSLVDPPDHLTQLKPPQNDVVLTKLISENVVSNVDTDPSRVKKDIRTWTA